MIRSWRTIAASVGVTLALLPQAAIAGPFGIDMGAPISRYQVEEALGNGRYRLASVPVSRSDLDFVIVTATPSQGVCKVSAVGDTIKDDAYGYGIRSAFDELKEALQTKYGPSRDYDFLNYGSIWNEPREFAMALYKDERSLDAFWSNEDGTPLADNVESIALSGVGLSSSSTYWRIQYEFLNFEACNAELERKDNNAL